MELKAYTLEKLETSLTPVSSGITGIVSITPLRLASYLNNPRSEKTDYVLLEMHHEGQLVAYRTLLPDCFYDRKGSKHRFAWLSGNYVSPEFRRQGISTRLLQHAEAHWDGRLMYTNYAPDSKAVYDRTGQFPVLTRREGKRFYLRASSKELLGRRTGFGNVLQKGDNLVNWLRKGKLQKIQSPEDRDCTIEKITIQDNALRLLVEKEQQKSLFRRDVDVFTWILEYPWITTDQVDPIGYHFSYEAKKIENHLLKFTLPGNRGIGFMWLLIHNSKLSVPYAFTDHEAIYPLMARTLIHTMASSGCAYSTIRHPLLMEQLAGHRKWFLSIRNMPQLLFTHKNMAELVPDDLEIQDGDGDVVFTG